MFELVGKEPGGSVLKITLPYHELAHISGMTDEKNPNLRVRKVGFIDGGFSVGGSRSSSVSDLSMLLTEGEYTATVEAANKKASVTFKVESTTPPADIRLSF